MKTIQIENKQGKVKLNESVTKESITRMVEEIGRLFGAKAAAEGADFGTIMNMAENAVDVLDLEINSPGGSVFDGYTIYQEIKSLQDRGVVVNATITGMAASMASVICMACDKVAIVPHGRMMIHDASNEVRGNADDMRKMADLLDSVSNNIAEIYSGKTGKDIEDIRSMMKKETWMNAKESVANGFADEIFDIRGQSPKSQGMSLLAKLFPDKSEEVAKLEAALAESETFRNELEAATAEVSALKEAEITNIAKIAELNEIKAGLETAKAELQAKLDESTKTIEAKDAEIVALSLAGPALVVEALAAIGQPEPIEPAADNATKSHLEVFSELKGAAATEYFRKHKKEIKAEQNQLSK